MNNITREPTMGWLTFPVYSDMSAYALIKSGQRLFLNRKGLLKPMPVWADGYELGSELLAKKFQKLSLRRGVDADNSLYYVTPRRINRGELVVASLGVPSNECVLMAFDSHDGYVCEKLGHYLGDGLQRSPFVWITKDGKLYNQVENLPTFCGERNHHEWALVKKTGYHPFEYHEYKHCIHCSAVKDAAFPKIEVSKAPATSFRVKAGMEPKGFSMFPYFQRKGRTIEMQVYTWSDGKQTTKFLCGGETIKNLEMI